MFIYYYFSVQLMENKNLRENIIESNIVNDINKEIILNIKITILNGDIHCTIS